MVRRSLLAIGLLVMLAATACKPNPVVATGGGGGGGGLLWQADYGRMAPGLSALGPWQAEQEPAPDRIRIVDRPDHGRVMRVELRPGDITDTGGYRANRAEVYARHHTGSRSAPAHEWADPIGSTRWYGFDLYIPAGFVTDPTGLVWESLMQWKGAWGGQPAIALEVKQDRLQLAGASGRNDLGPLAKGRWERLVIGVHFHPDQGWVEVARDGVTVLPRTHRPTMQWRSPGVADPTYLKQGIYRDPRWTVTHVVLYGPLEIGTTKASVL